MPAVMTGADAKHVLELAPVEDEQPVEALAAHAANPALGMCVRVRRLQRVCGSRRSVEVDQAGAGAGAGARDCDGTLADGLLVEA
jgi:hypothetical protein